MKENLEIKKSGFGTAGMVCGIVAICLSFIPVVNYVSIVLGILSIIFSATSLIKKASKGQAIAGLALGIISVVIVVNSYVALGKVADTVSDSINEFSNSLQVDNESQDKMTIDKFNKIETGMTYNEVVEIVGSDGELSTESSYGNQSMQIYYWYASNGISNATVSFMNGKVTGKSQVGL